MKNKIILLLFFLLLVMPFTSAEAYVKYSNVSLKQPCYNGGDYCSASSKCVITVINPVGNITVSNQSMTNQNAFHNYTINTRNTSTSGTFDYCITCRDGAYNGSECFQFTINPGGVDFSLSRTGAMNRAVWVLLFLGIIPIIFSLFVKFVPFKWSLVIIGLIFILIGVNILFVSLQDEVVNPKVEGFFDFMTATTFLLYWFGFTLIIFVWIVTFINTVLHRKATRRKMMLGE